LNTTQDVSPASGWADWKPLAWTFGLTAGLLVWARQASPLPVLLADRYLPGSGFAEILVLAVYASCVVRIILKAPRTARIRSRIWALFSLVFFGQLVLGLAGMERMLMTGDLHLPVPALILAGPVYRGHGLFMPILYGSTVLLVGPAWCSFLCYIGSWPVPQPGQDSLPGPGGQHPRRLSRGGPDLTVQRSPAPLLFPADFPVRLQSDEILELDTKLHGRQRKKSRWQFFRRQLHVMTLG